MKNFFKSYLKKYVLLLIACFLLAIGFVVAQLFIPIYVGYSIDAIVKEGFSETVTNYILIIASLIGLNFIFQYSFDCLTSIFNQKVIYSLRKDLFDKYNFVPVSYIDSKLKGDLILRSVNDVENIGLGLLGGFRQLLQGIVVIVGTLCFMFGVNWFLGLLVVIITPLSIFISSFIAKKCMKYFKKQAGSAGILSSKSFETLNNIDTIQAYNYDEKLIENFKEANQELYKSGQKAQFYSSWINPTTRLINNLTYAIVLIVGVVLLIDPSLMNTLGITVFSVGALQSLLVYATQYGKPFNEISSVITEIQNSLASLRRVSEVLNVDSEIDSGEKYPGTAANLKFEDVKFGYSGDNLIFNNLNFQIKKNEKIAIVGPTGCGKTTIINLLMRFYNPVSGNIYFNDINIKDISKDSYRQHFGMVLQDTWIFDGTILDNIKYVKEDATLEEVIDASKRAHAHKFITKFKDGYNTKISSHSGLSEGEKQLICIARVILANPEIVILDEATSNIDSRTEELVTKGFNELLKNKTSIVIAHRLSTIKNSDRILVLNDGNFVESGTHKELLDKKGFYYELHNSQYEN